MNASDAKERLESAGLKIKTEARLPNDTGTQLRLTNGAIVNIFDNGNTNVQGKNKADVQEILGVTTELQIRVPEQRITR
jgi:predicted nucleotide-binding protein